MKIFLSFAGCFLLLFSLGCGAGPGINGISPSTGGYSNSSLSGSYVYQLAGSDVSSGVTAVPYEESGVFIADGKGNITGGVDDATEEGTGTALGNTISGTYTIASDGTGSITLNGTAFQSTNFVVTLGSSSTVYMVEADALNASGTAQLQDSSAISAAPSGTFAFRMHTTSAQGVSVATVGQFTVSAGVFQSGSVDVNQSGTASSPTLTNFTFNAPISDGRGTGNFTESLGATASFNYYIVDGNNVRMLVTDTSANVGGHGVAEKQTGGPFSASSFSGSYAFGSEGDDNSSIDAVNTVGQFTASAGSITGAYDSVQDSTPLNNVPITAGSYQLASNGRVTATFTSSSGTVSRIFWMVGPSRAFFITANNPTDGSLTEDGTADLQQTTPFSTSTINGQFALTMQGVNPSFFIDRVGTLKWDGAGKLTLNEFVNDTGSGSSPGILTGTYAVSSNGRATGTINSLSVNSNDLVFYMISNTDGYVLQEDSGTELMGMISQQR
ncbi:MAG: hypothetical protein ACRD2U_17980 [Terriglobales bacterium]